MHTSIHLFQSLSPGQLGATPWIAARQASLSITSSWSLLKLMSIESVMPSSHLILCRPRLLLPPIPPSVRVFSNESALHMKWPKYWNFSFSISPSNEHPGLISFRMNWLDLLAVQGTLIIELISHASKVMLKIIQARLQQYVNRELPDVQAGFRKGRGTRDQIANIHWIIEKQESSRKTSISALLTVPKPMTVITINCGKFWKRWE